ncbi:NAD(P)/FAD-dependent oxidoreductase [Pseudothermotoga sp. U03pept]|uniref:NAD(P)/FAD-dependent oxidoreductase n=1 Tax=Pseudothermotoga sp. U03pept TaxID=3447012 RepID=UPI003F05D620
MQNAYDCIVIGAGIIGLSCAYQLAKARKTVLVLERGDVGCGTSGACDHMILLQSKAPGLPLRLAMESLEIYREWQSELQEDIEFATRGGMILIDKKDHMPVMEDFVKKQKSIGLNVEILEKKYLKKKQPWVSDHVIASTYSPEDSQVNPFKVLFALYQASSRIGVKLLRYAAVTEIKRKSEYWEVRTTAGEVYSAQVVVNAAGVWSGEIASYVGLNLPIRPKRGQIIVTEPIEEIGETDAWDANYIISKHLSNFERDETSKRLGLGFAMSRTHSGNYLIGSTREYVGFNRSTTYEALKAITNRAVELFPVFDKVRIIRSFAGLRPACDDGKYIIGEDPANPGFFIATGHEGDGIALAPITGKLISQLICGERTTLEIDAISPARFRVASEVAQRN